MRRLISGLDSNQDFNLVRRYCHAFSNASLPSDHVLVSDLGKCAVQSAERSRLKRLERIANLEEEVRRGFCFSSRTSSVDVETAQKACFHDTSNHLDLHNLF